MVRYKKIGLLIGLVLLCGCKKDNARSYFPENMERVHVEIIRFDQALLSIDTNHSEESIKQLYSDYKDIMPVYVEGILGLGDIDTLEFSKLYADFLKDSIVSHTCNEVEKQFASIKDIQEELNEGFTRLHYLYPTWEIPKVFFFVSGFNGSIYQYENMIGVGVDMYLGSDYPYYDQVAYNYQKQTMRKSSIAGDILNFYLSQHLPDTRSQNRLLEGIIFFGKQIYLLEQLLPNQSPWDVIGYTKAQWDWCMTNEQAIWNRVMDKRDLFKTESMVINSYLNDGPFTSEISQESPGRLGIWIGWRIIDSYMRNNKQVSLTALMANGDAQKILEQSQYKP